MVRSFPLLLIAALTAACNVPDPRPDGGTPPGDAGPPDAGEPDAGEPDAGEPDAGDPDAGAITVLDWRAVRGADLETTALPVGLEDELFGMTSTGLIVQSGCDGGTCDYVWLQPDGGVQQPARALRPAFNAPPANATGKRLLMIEAPSFSSCTYKDGPFPIVSGGLHLLDTETGAPLTTLPKFQTHPWGETQFTAMGRWFRPAPMVGGVCGSFDEELRRVEAPFEVAPAWAKHLLVEDELPDGRWVALDNNTSALGFVDPEEPGSFDAIAADVQSWYVRDGWTYAFERSPVRRIAAVAPDGTRREHVPSLDEGWYPVTTSGRWIALREWINTVDSRRYWILDAHGEFPGVRFYIQGGRVGEGLHLIGAEDLVLVTTPDEHGNVAPRLFDLRTGALEHLADTAHRGVTLGEGEAAIAFDQDRALLIERGRIQTVVEGRITDVYAASLPGTALPLPQRDIAMIVRSPELGVYALDLFHLRARQLVHLSDRIFYGPQHGWGLADESCGRPWVTRSVGDGSSTLTTPSRAFYFLQYEPWPQGTSLYVAPLDLSAPPRRLSTVPSTVECHAPLLSLDGTRVGAMADGYDTEPRRTIHSASFP